MNEVIKDAFECALENAHHIAAEFDSQIPDDTFQTWRFLREQLVANATDAQNVDSILRCVAGAIEARITAPSEVDRLRLVEAGRIKAMNALKKSLSEFYDLLNDLEKTGDDPRQIKLFGGEK